MTELFQVDWSVITRYVNNNFTEGEPERKSDWLPAVAKNSIGGICGKIIGPRAFQECESIKSVTFSEGTETIEHEAFRDCPNLTEVHLPDSLKTMEYAAFMLCRKLEILDFGKKLKVLEPNVLYRCNGIQKLVIPETVQKVDRESGVNGLDGLTSLIIESDLSKNKTLAIIDCQNLTEVVFKKGFANLKISEF